MSKKGRSTVRGLLYMAGLTGIRTNSIIKKRYAAARANGRNHYDTMGIIMHKILRIIYGVLKSKTPFNAEIDENNQITALAKQKKNEQQLKTEKKTIKKNKRRYQEEKTDDVPLSFRAVQKREKLTDS